MRRTAVLLTTGLVGVTLAALAFAQVQNKFQVASAAEGRGYPRSLMIVIDSPPDYTLDFIGRGANDASWKGPRYEATLRPSLGAESTLDWSASIERKPSNRQTIIDNLVQDWPVILEGSEAIERRLGGRDAGTLPGTWVLTQGTPMAGEARYEAGLVFPLCGRTALLDISALTPSGDSAGGAMGFGEYMIMGTKPTLWNRDQVLATIRGISVEGSLPASRLVARSAGRRVGGTARDCTGQASAGVTVQLERRSGRRWVRAAAGKTTTAGSFSLPARVAGIYRVSAGATRSNPVSVR